MKWLLYFFSRGWHASGLGKQDTAAYILAIVCGPVLASKCKRKWKVGANMI